TWRWSACSPAWAASKKLNGATRETSEAARHRRAHPLPHREHHGRPAPGPAPPAAGGVRPRARRAHARRVGHRPRRAAGAHRPGGRRRAGALGRRGGALRPRQGGVRERWRQRPPCRPGGQAPRQVRGPGAPPPGAGRRRGAEARRRRARAARLQAPRPHHRLPLRGARAARRVGVPRRAPAARSHPLRLPGPRRRRGAAPAHEPAVALRGGARLPRGPVHRPALRRRLLPGPAGALLEPAERLHRHLRLQPVDALDALPAHPRGPVPQGARDGGPRTHRVRLRLQLLPARLRRALPARPAARLLHPQRQGRGRGLDLRRQRREAAAPGRPRRGRGRRVSTWHPAYREGVLANDYRFAAENLLHHFVDAMTAHLDTVLRMPAYADADTQAQGAELRRALVALHDAPAPEQAPDVPDLYFALQRRLEERLGDAVGLIRVGLSRNDLDMTVYKMNGRAYHLEVGRRLLRLRELLLDRAERHLETVLIAE